MYFQPFQSSEDQTKQIASLRNFNAVANLSLCEMEDPVVKQLPFYTGKVRDLYDVDSARMILVATDRLSAFDVVFPDPVPGKGKILTKVSRLWFSAIRNSGLQERLQFTDHLIESDVSRFPDGFDHAEWTDRAVLVRKCKRVDFECVVRGYLAGSGYKEYTKTGAVCGNKLPSGLLHASRLPEPIFTPATKVEAGHDENVSFEFMRREIGPIAEHLRDISIAIFRFASAKMEEAGIILCDTKFEFGLLDDRVILIDEALTPDSSRYWDASSYSPGTNPAGFDKQYIRDYVESIHWDKKPPAPNLPPDVTAKTIELYEEILRKIQHVI